VLHSPDPNVHMYAHLGLLFLVLQMNLADSERIAGCLESVGYTCAEDASDADVLVSVGQGNDTQFPSQHHPADMGYFCGYRCSCTLCFV
jgi:hypothetical protein